MSLLDAIAPRFEEVQLSMANHRKNCAGLYKAHLQASTGTMKGKPKKNHDSVQGEQDFGDVFMDMLGRVMLAKKGTCADRTLRFVGSYIKYLNEKTAESQNESDDTMASRFVARLLEWLTKGLHAKDKLVRLRCVLSVSEMIAHVGEIDDGTYELLREGLLDRMCDKEASVRVQAAVGLSKLIGTEDPDEVAAGAKTILETLLEVTCFDPAPEVRRAALAHLPITEETLPILLTRTRDTDAVTRKMVYSSVLLTQLSHPRQLTISQREDIVKTGLGDREPAVRAAVGKLLHAWFQAALADEQGEELPWTGDDGGVMRGFVRFLGLFDVVGPGEVVAVDAIQSVLKTNQSLGDVFVFPQDYWQNLTPESAVLARVFLDNCLASNSSRRLESASMPAVTALAFHVQETYNRLIRMMEEAELLGTAEDHDEREEELAKHETILGALLRMASKQDYMDEIGRRKMFTVVKDMIAHADLPPGLIDLCLDVLKELVADERELIRVVVETVIDLREQDEPADGGDFFGLEASQSENSISRKERSLRRAREVQEMSPDERREADEMDVRCLTLVIAMLERVHGSFEDNSTLEGMLADLIIPAVKRKELVIREKGLISLGLCCLIAKGMALNSIQLFLSQVQSAPEELKLKLLQIIFDLLIMYDNEFLGKSEETANQIITFLLQMLEAEDSDDIQAVICIGICKLLLAGVVKDPRVLTSLALTYVSPATNENAQIRQCLSYFFPVYCYSNPENQSRVQSIFIEAFDLASQMSEQLDDNQDMISPHQFGLLIVDWTDPHKAAYKANPLPNVHAHLAIDMLKEMYDSDRYEEDRKTFCQLLSQLQMTNDLDSRSLYKLKLLFENFEQQCPFNNVALDKAMRRAQDKFLKVFGKELEALQPEQFDDDEEIKELRELTAIERDASEALRASARRQGAKARGASISDSSDEDEVPSTPKRNGRNLSVMEASDEEFELASNVAVTPMKKGPKRTHTPTSVRKHWKKKVRETSPVPIRRSTRTPAGKKTPKYADEPESDGDQDSDEESEDDVPVQVPPESGVQEDESVDDDEEEDEEEVEELLASSP